jgi:hypothetical protein
VSKRTGIRGLLLLASAVVLGWTAYLVPLLAVFMVLALSTGIVVGLLIHQFTGLDKIPTWSALDSEAVVCATSTEPTETEDYAITVPPTAETTPNSPEFDDDARFIALFELLILPDCGRCQDQSLRAKAFRELWPEVKAGRLDGFALRDRVMRLTSFTPAQRTELMREITTLAAEAAQKKETTTS